MGIEGVFNQRTDSAAASSSTGLSSPNATIFGRSYSTMSQVAGKVCEKVDRLVKTAETVKKVFEMAKKGAPVALGCGEMYAGAALCTTLGGAAIGLPVFMKGIYDVVVALNPKGVDEDIKDLLDSAKAKSDLIELLGNANSSSIENIELHLKAIDGDFARLSEKLTEISQIADLGNHTLVEGKARAQQLCEESKGMSLQAREIFVAAQQHIQTANAKLTHAIGRIDDLVELSHSRDGDMESLVNEFEKIAQEIGAECREALEQIQAGEAKYLEAFEITEMVKVKQLAVYETFSTLQEKVQSELDKIQLVAEHGFVVEEYKGDKQKMEQELSDLKFNNEMILRLQKEMREDLDKLEIQADGKLGNASLAFGATVTGLVTALTASPLIGIPVGLVAAKACHQREQIKKLVLGEGPLPVPPRPDNIQMVTYEFSQKSTGVYGRALGRPSLTEGVATIRLTDKEVLDVAFNLNKPTSVSQEGSQRIYNKLDEKVSSGEMSSSECLAILDKLETLEINRGYAVKRGLVSTKTGYLGILRERCNQKM